MGVPTSPLRRQFHRRSFMALIDDLRQTEISDFRVSVFVEKDVGWFEVIMNDGLVGG